MKKKLIDDTGRITDPTKALNCPFCGSKAKVTTFANNKGAFAECSSDTCALWGFKTDLNEWNARSLFTRKRLNKYFFEPSASSIVDSALIEDYTLYGKHESLDYRCKCCGNTAKNIEAIKHSKGCEVARMLKAVP